MANPFSWSFPIGRLFGITIRIHILFPLVAIAMIMRASVHDKAAPGIWLDATIIVGLLFVSVLLHEFGHCYAARRVGGDAQEVLLWPLGGLAAVDCPHTARANFLVAAGGPAVNLAICVGCGLALAFCFEAAWQPPWNIFAWPGYVDASGVMKLTKWNGTVDPLVSHAPVVLLARLFWVNWFGLLFNLALVGFPFDSGRMLQATLWPYVGYQQAMRYAIYAGFVSMAVLVVAGVVMQEMLLLLLAWFTYAACSQQWLMLEQGGEDSLFGYDFSQGYTSLEREQERELPPAPPPKKVGFVQRWLQRRAERKRLRDAERQEAEERRMDELLDKIQREGKHALTDEEQRFLKRVSERYKNRH